MAAAALSGEGEKNGERRRFLRSGGGKKRGRPCLHPLEAVTGRLRGATALLAAGPGAVRGGVRGSLLGRRRLKTAAASPSSPAPGVRGCPLGPSAPLGGVPPLWAGRPGGFLEALLQKRGCEDSGAAIRTASSCRAAGGGALETSDIVRLKVKMGFPPSVHRWLCLRHKVTSAGASAEHQGHASSARLSQILGASPLF